MTAQKIITLAAAGMALAVAFRGSSAFAESYPFTCNGHPSVIECEPPLQSMPKLAVALTHEFQTYLNEGKLALPPVGITHLVDPAKDVITARGRVINDICFRGYTGPSYAACTVTFLTPEAHTRSCVYPYINAEEADNCGPQAWTVSLQFKEKGSLWFNYGLMSVADVADCDTGQYATKPPYNAACFPGGKQPS